MYMYMHVYSMYRQRVTEGRRKRKMNKEDMNKAVYQKTRMYYAQNVCLISLLLFSSFLFLYLTYLFILSMHIRIFSIVLTSTSTAEKLIALHISLNSMAIVDM